MMNDLFELVRTVTLHGCSDSTLARVTLSAETRLYPDQTDMSGLNIEDYLVVEDNVGHTPCRRK
jgi:hypothetical protein